MKREQDVVAMTPCTDPPAVMPRWPVSALLICLVLACLIPGLIGAALLTYHGYLTGRAALERTSLQTTRALVQAVDSHLSKAQAVAQSLAASDAIRRRDFAALHQQARALLALNPLGSNFALSDTEGQQLVNTLREYGDSLPPHGRVEQIRQVVQTGQPSISQVFKGNLSNKLLITVDVPVVVDGNVAYVVTAGLRPENFNLILKAQGLPPDWVAAVLDNNGTFVARTHALEQFVGQQPSAELSRQIVKKKEGVFASVTPDGIPVLSIYSRSAETGWTVALGIPLQAMEAEYQAPLRLLVIGMATLFVIGLGLAWCMSERIARSVRSLTSSAQALGMGETVQPSEVYIKEAGEVARALMDASRLLQERTESLRKVNESLLAREVELAQAQRLAKFGNWYWNLKTDEITVSDSLRAVYGRESVPSFREMKGTLLTAESWERVKGAMQATVQTGVGFDLEFQMIHGSGSLIWVNSKCEAVRDDRGDVVALRGSNQDITERKQAQQELFEAETRFRSIFEQAAAGIALVALDGKWLQVNAQFCAIVGYSRDTLLEMTFQDITFAEDLAVDIALVNQLLARQMPSHSIEKRYIRKDGTLVWVNLTVSLVRTFDGTPDYFIAVIENIQRRKETELALANERESRQRQLEQLVSERTEALQAAIQKSERLARQDALTGLQNRLSAGERLRGEFVRMKRTGRAYTALLLDIDHFKRINDTYGHQAGDLVLQQIASVLERSIRETDFVARFGGEEFLVLLPETGKDGALTIAEKIRYSVAQQTFPGSEQITISVGVSIADLQDSNEDEAVRRADAALYMAKGKGRNRVQLG